MSTYLKTNKQVLIDKLEEKIELICKSFGLNYMDWDLDKSLYKSILRLVKKQTIKEETIRYTSEYNALIEAAKQLKVKLPLKYNWLYQLKLK